MKERLLRIGVLVLGLVTAAAAVEAAPILVQTGGPGVFGNVVILNADPSNPVFDISGAATVEAVDLSVPSDIGPAFLFGLDPFPEDHLVLTNTALSEADEFFFDFSSSTFSGSTWTLNALGVALGPLTDPVLISFLGGNVAQFSLLTPNGIPLVVGDAIIGTVFSYSLDFIAHAEQATEVPVPEPATLTLLGTGIFLAARRRRKQAA